MVLVWLPLPPRTMAMSCWLSTPSPSMPVMSPISARFTNRPSWHWKPSRLTLPVTPPLTPGMSTRQQRVMPGLLPFPSTPTPNVLVPAILTGCLVAPSACACIPAFSLLTPEAIGLSSSAVLFSFHKPREPPVIMNNSSRGPGCVKNLNWELGGLQRVLDDSQQPPLQEHLLPTNQL